MEAVAKKAKEKLTVSQVEWKVLRFFLIAFLVVFLVKAILDQTIEENMNIEQKLGSYSPYSISIQDSLLIKTYHLDPYFQCIQEGNTQEAYEKLTDEYRKVISYDAYVESLEGIDASTFDVAEIKMKSDQVYVASVVYQKNGVTENVDYLLFKTGNSIESMKISPDNFIIGYENLKFHADSIDLVVNACIVYTNQITMNVYVKNTSWFKTLEFQNVGVGYDDVMDREEDTPFTLAPGEEKIMEISYDVDYYIPNNIRLKRLLDEKTIRTYTFYFEEAK